MRCHLENPDRELSTLSSKQFNNIGDQAFVTGSGMKVNQPCTAFGTPFSCHCSCDGLITIHTIV